MPCGCDLAADWLAAWLLAGLLAWSASSHTAQNHGVPHFVRLDSEVSSVMFASASSIALKEAIESDLASSKSDRMNKPTKI